MTDAAPLPSDQAELLFVGNATLLIRFGSLTLLTDPNFLHRGEFAYLGHGLASRRLTEPALTTAQIPPDLDAVVLSHLHGDHWDRRARRALNRATPVITTPHAARRLQAIHGFHRAVGLQTWQQHDLVRENSRVRITSMPGRHAAYGPVRALLPPVMGSMLEFATAAGDTVLRLYLSGDTLFFDGLAAIAARYPDLHLAVLHLGGTRIAGLLLTMDGAQGARAAELLGPRSILPVHFNDYRAFHSPLDDFIDEARHRGLAERLIHCLPGQRIRIGPGRHA